MPAIAGIDIGSNAIRLIIANADQNRRMEVVERAREAVRLGQDVFSNDQISEKMMDGALKALERFKGLMNNYGVVLSKTVGTSALRDAKNGAQFVARAKKNLGIDVEIIGGEEEARLINLAVQNKMDTRQKTALLVEIGGGSVEITLTDNEKIASSVSLDIGTVRLICELKGKKTDEKEFAQMVQEYVGGLKKDFKKAIGPKKIDLCVGTGGNIETMGGLCKDEMGGDSNEVIPLPLLNSLVKKLQNLSFEERIREIGLRPDRADVILPAAIVLQRIAKLAEVENVHVPYVGLRDGVLLDLWGGIYAGTKGIQREQALSSARLIGKKYQYDESHAETVARLSGMLFDATKELHGLNGEHRVLLEAAALLHDVGSFIGVSKHHKHTYYLLSSTPIIGLNKEQQAVVANIARYHRMASPTERHEGFAALSTAGKAATTKLSALLRLADAMDTEHEGIVKKFRLDLTKSKASLALEGSGDLLIEKWKLARKCDLFEEVFQLKLVLE
ncbi:MAG: Ppx/GppA family phosphatase [Nitrospinae bacterium]|nr:Ppx/GppA family phosphatase [Nitrospinota bacterium]